MKPLTIDMGGELKRKLSSEADYRRIRSASRIYLKNTQNNAYDGEFRAVSSLNDTIAFEDYGGIVFVQEQAQTEDGYLDGAIYCRTYLDDDNNYIIEVTES